MTRIKAGALPGSAGWPRQRRGSARVRHGLGMARMLMLATAATLAVALVLPAAGGASPPSGDAGGSIAGAPPGAVAGSLSAGGAHSCGLRTDGTLACWGLNNAGQASPPTGSFTAVTAGEAAHSCGLRTDGTLACWGVTTMTARPRRPPAASPRSALAALQLRLRTDGTLACWGRQRRRPGVPADRHVHRRQRRQLAQLRHRTDGTLACWGSNSFGQATRRRRAPSPPSAPAASTAAGCGPTARSPAGATTTPARPRRRPAPSQRSAPAATRAAACATDGTLACWGDNSFDGQATPPTGSFRAVSAGELHSCGLRTDGTLACWGDNV